MRSAAGANLSRTVRILKLIRFILMLFMMIVQMMR